MSQCRASENTTQNYGNVFFRINVSVNAVNLINKRLVPFDAAFPINKDKTIGRSPFLKYPCLADLVKPIGSTLLPPANEVWGIFLHLSVIPFTRGRCLPNCMLRYTPPPRHSPWTHPPDRHPLWTHTSWTHTHPDTPQTDHPPDSGIRSTSGRYASYWNAYLY